MDAWLLDSIIGVVSLSLFIVLLILPSFIPDLNNGYFYIASLGVFVIMMSAAGYVINRKIA